jgi:hypothetical protein
VRWREFRIHWLPRVVWLVLILTSTQLWKQYVATKPPGSTLSAHPGPEMQVRTLPAITSNTLWIVTASPTNQSARSLTTE